MDPIVAYTTYSNGHYHMFELDENKNGETTETFPEGYTSEHKHTITNWILETVENHTHKIHESDT